MSCQRKSPTSTSSSDEVDWLTMARAAQYGAGALARRLHVSVRQLERCFVDSCGQAPQKWLDCVRIWEAARLLLEGQRTKEIFEELGFANESSLYHAFKRYHGVTPAEYLANHVHLSRSDDAALRRTFPGESVPAEWAAWLQPAKALGILQDELRRSVRLELVYRRAQRLERK